MRRRLADGLLAGLKAALGGWVATRRLSRSDIREILDYLGVELDGWVAPRRSRNQLKEARHERYGAGR